MKRVRQEFKASLQVYLLVVRDRTLAFKDLPNTVEYIYFRFQIDCFSLFLFYF